ncbi:MAG: outer membrane protein assembly factor BamB [Pseudomonadota bacterium]
MNNIAKLAMRFSLLILMLNFIAACSYIPWFGDDEEVLVDPRTPTELSEIPQEVVIQKNWEVSLGGDSKKEFVQINPHAFGDGIAFAQTKGDVAVFNSTDGQKIWSANIDSAISGGVGGNEQVLVLGTLDGEILGLQSNDGNKVWEQSVTSEISAISSSTGDVVVARLSDNSLLGIDLVSGEKLWTVAQTSPALTLRGANTPIITSDIVYAGMDNGKVLAISTLTGNTVWEARVSVPSGRNELQRLVDVDGQIAADDFRVYAASYHGRVVSIDKVNGRIIWARDIASVTGVTIDDNIVYVSDKDDNVWALEKDSGVSVWKQDGLLYREISAPVLQDRVIMVGDFEGYIHILSKEDGRFIGRTRLGKAPIQTSNTGTNSVSYISDSEGRLASITIE